MPPAIVPLFKSVMVNVSAPVLVIVKLPETGATLEAAIYAMPTRFPVDRPRAVEVTVTVVPERA